MLFSGVDLTGMYLNPVNATNQTYGCHGPWFVEFVLVYWIAPFLGTALAVVTQNDLKSVIKSLQYESVVTPDINKLLNGSRNYLRVGNCGGDASSPNPPHVGAIGVASTQKRRSLKKRFWVNQKH